VLSSLRQLFEQRLRVLQIPTDPSLCGTVELELIWRKRKVLSYNNVGKLTPPRRRLNLVHERAAELQMDSRLAATLVS
jgi:hypothetical protein